MITALPTVSSTTKFVLAKFSTPGALRLSTIVNVAFVSAPSVTALVGTALLNTKPTVRFPSTRPSSKTPTTTVTTLLPAGKVTTWLVGWKFTPATAVPLVVVAKLTDTEPTNPPLRTSVICALVVLSLTL